MTPELFKMMTGVNMVHVPYRGIAPALTGLLGGSVQVLFANPSQSIPYLQGNKLRALAITTATRSAALPDIPSIAEFVPGYEASSIFGLGAPKNTPTEITEILNKHINLGLADPTIRARLGDLDATPLAGSPADFARLIIEETQKWEKVVRAANISLQ
jgi:tripartite-type tricarboxylate transporter receptor subunit TctC